MTRPACRRVYAERSSPQVTHLGWASAATRLPAVFGGPSRLRLNCSDLTSRRALFELFGNAAGACRVDVDPGAHRACERDLLDVAPLRRGGLRADDLVDQCRVV